MSRFRFGVLLFTMILGATRAWAQNPVRPPQDTSRAARDTTTADTTGIIQDTSKATPAFTDSIHPIPQLPEHYVGPAHGFTDGVWTWNRVEFQNEAAITVGDLLERIPSVLVLRSGLYVQPEAASAFGATANRLELWLDGYALDPLLESSVDLAKLELAEVDSVRVERRLGAMRVHVYTIAARENRAYSRIEAAVGQPNANLFRGIFLAPKLFFGAIGAALDRIDTKGTRGQEPADQAAGWAKWSFIRGGAGLQVEYRRVTTDRNPVVPWIQKYVRDDLMLRGRARLTTGLVAEVFGGRSTADLDTTSNSSGGDSIPRIKEKNTQFGGAVSFVSPFFWANGSVRMRDALALPATQLDGAAGVSLKLLSVTGEAQQTNWRDAGSALSWSVRALATPRRGISVFGETSKQDRGIPYISGLPDSAAIITSSKGYRVGAQVEARGVTLGGALLHTESDLGIPFGLPFDRQGARYFGANAKGYEISGRAPLLLLKGLYAEGMVTNWLTGALSVYMPSRQFRTGIEYHAVPLKSGNLEILGRIELIHRGQMVVPAVPSEENPSPDPLTMPAIQYVDAYLQIRVIDLRAFIRMEDLQGQVVNEVADRDLRGARIFYGVKWQFFN